MQEEVRIWSGATQGYFAYHPEEREVLLESFSAPPEAFFTQVGEIGKSAEFARELKHFAACGFLIRDNSAGTLTPASEGPPNISYSVNEADRRKFIKGIEKSTEMFFAAGSKKVRPLVHGAKFFTSFNEARQFIRGASVEELLLYSSHPMGTCRIGDDPTKCVVRPEDGRTYDVEGLYITDSSLHPTALGANPQMTIMASSLALARRMAKN